MTTGTQQAMTVTMTTTPPQSVFMQVWESNNKKKGIWKVWLNIPLSFMQCNLDNDGYDIHIHAYSRNINKIKLLHVSLSLSLAQFCVYMISWRRARIE